MEIEYLKDIFTFPLKEGWHLIQSKRTNKQYIYHSENGILGQLPPSANNEVDFELIERILKKKLYNTQKTGFIIKGTNDQIKSSRLMLFLTANCNLNCVYCHCNSKAQKKAGMNKSFAINIVDKFIDDIYKPYQSEENLRITFMGGGDPFLKINLIKDIVKHVREIGIKGEYTIVTNGTIGTKQDWQWLVSNNFHITISADGPPAIQNAQRKYANQNRPTSVAVEKTVNYLNELGSKINIRTTVLDTTKKNVNSICEYFLNFNCVKTHHLEPVSFAGRAVTLKSMNEVDFYSCFFSNYASYLFSNPSRFKSSWFRPFKKSDGFCGAAYFNAIVTHDGFISLCSEVDSSMLKTNIGEIYLCGQVQDENAFASIKAKEFAEKNSIQKIDTCSKCIIRYKCGGGCYIKKDRDFNDKNIFYKAYCKNSIALVMSYLIGLYEKKHEQN